MSLLGQHFLNQKSTVFYIENMYNLPPAIKNLLDHFNRLPGVGPKTALRFVFYLLKRPKEELLNFSKVLENITNSITECKICHSFSTTELCGICNNPLRNKHVLCIVADEEDKNAIENTKEFKGVYHCLGGIINPLEGITPNQLKIKDLVHRIELNKPQEIILAFNPTIEGEATILYLTNLFKSYNIKTTRLARGLPVGSELEYADEITLTDALKERKEIGGQSGNI